MTGKKILIIEDNDLNLELTSDLLAAHGFLVYAARSAEQGLEIARQILPDLVLMDLGLPGMDGLCATRELKADPLTQHLTVVGLTAHAMKGDTEIAYKAGCDGYLIKPIDTRALIENVTRFITQPHFSRNTLNPLERIHAH